MTVLAVKQVLSTAKLHYHVMGKMERISYMNILSPLKGETLYKINTHACAGMMVSIIVSKSKWIGILISVSICSLNP